MRTLVIYINITIFPLFMTSHRAKQTKITYLIFTKQRIFFAPNILKYSSVDFIGSFFLF